MSYYYVLVAVCDEGVDSIDYVFDASGREEVAEYMLTKMRQNDHQGDCFMSMIMSASIDGCKYNHELSHQENKDAKKKYILSRTPNELLELIDATYVDGDSSFKVTLAGYPKNEIIKLNKEERTKPDEWKVIDTETKLSNLIDYCFHDMRVKCILYDNKRWYQHSLPEWGLMREGCEYEEHDPDYPCYGYFEHKYDKDADSDDEKEVELPYKPIKVGKLRHIQHVFTEVRRGEFNAFTRVELKHDVIVQNSQGTLNTDHRGSNHMGIDIDHLFKGTVKIKAGLYVLQDFADLLWRVKGNKFDDQYELVFRMSNGGSVEFQDNVWHVELAVDHGS